MAAGYHALYQELLARRAGLMVAKAQAW
jgi:hypothetical protein